MQIDAFHALLINADEREYDDASVWEPWFCWCLSSVWFDFPLFLNPKPFGQGTGEREKDVIPVVESIEVLYVLKAS